jgi:hypothetical protein
MNIYDAKVYYIPTYIKKEYNSSINILQITKQILSHVGLKEALKEADFFLSVQDLGMSNKPVLTCYNVYDQIKMESRKTKWSDSELKELDGMIRSTDADSISLGIDIFLGINPQIMKSAVERNYIGRKSISIIQAHKVINISIELQKQGINIKDVSDDIYTVENLIKLLGIMYISKYYQKLRTMR